VHRGCRPADPSPDVIHQAHAGATTDGPPGDRGGGFCGAYFRDPDGNKICIYKMSV
jgi:catechol 2,3-dioxygenase-like lactoylglutathione lyase family enzyme